MIRFNLGPVWVRPSFRTVATQTDLPASDAAPHAPEPAFRPPALAADFSPSPVPSAAASAAVPAAVSPAATIDRSLRQPGGRPLPHVLRDPDLLRLLLGVARPRPVQSFAVRTAE